MSVDVNCHLGHWPYRRLVAEADALLQRLDRYAVNQACVGAFAGLFYRDSGQANRELLANLKPYRNRLLPWATINPAFPSWEHDLDEARQLGFVGIRLFPNYHGYTLSDPCVIELLRCLSPDALPVAIYHKFVDERLHHWTSCVPPADLAPLPPLVSRFPQQRFLLCGCSWPQLDPLVDVIRHSRIWIEISRLEGVEAIRELIGRIGLEHIVLGSHAPYFYMEAAHLKLTEAGLTASERAAILEHNPRALLEG